MYTYRSAGLIRNLNKALKVWLSQSHYCCSQQKVKFSTCFLLIKGVKGEALSRHDVLWVKYVRVQRTCALITQKTCLLHCAFLNTSFENLPPAYFFFFFFYQFRIKKKKTWVLKIRHTRSHSNRNQSSTTEKCNTRSKKEKDGICFKFL